MYIIIYVTSNIVKHIKKCDVYHTKIHQVPKPNKFKQQRNFVFVVIHKIQIFEPNFWNAYLSSLIFHDTDLFTHVLMNRPSYTQEWQILTDTYMYIPCSSVKNIFCFCFEQNVLFSLVQQNVYFKMLFHKIFCLYWYSHSILVIFLQNKLSSLYSYLVTDSQ